MSSASMMMTLGLAGAARAGKSGNKASARQNRRQKRRELGGIMFRKLSAKWSFAATVNLNGIVVAKCVIAITTFSTFSLMNDPLRSEDCLGLFLYGLDLLLN